MKRKLSLVLAIVLIAAILLPGCGKTEESRKYIIGATSVPHAEILGFVAEDLKAAGIEVEIREFSDYTLLNQALADAQIDANFFQHLPYLDDFIANSGEALYSIGPVHIEPMGVYSDKIDSLDALEDGAVVTIPNDTTNGGRALLLLADNGLITLKEGVSYNAALTDVVENPKNLEFKELDAALIPMALQDADIAVINTNYALQAGLNPMNDALVMESGESPFANVLVVREADQDDEGLLEIYSILTSEAVRDFILEQYENAVVPAF